MSRITHHTLCIKKFFTLKIFEKIIRIGRILERFLFRIKLRKLRVLSSLFQDFTKGQRNCTVSVAHLLLSPSVYSTLHRIVCCPSSFAEGT